MSKADNRPAKDSAITSLEPSAVITMPLGKSMSPATSCAVPSASISRIHGPSIGCPTAGSWSPVRNSLGSSRTAPPYEVGAVEVDAAGRIDDELIPALDFAATPVREPQAALMPTGRLDHREALGQQSRSRKHDGHGAHSTRAISERIRSAHRRPS